MNLGGMALRDGVLLQSERFWAAAVRRPDGVHVSSGEKARIPGRQVVLRLPVLRGLLRLGESLAVLPAVRRATGGPVLPQEEPRMLAATVASAAGTYVVRNRLPGLAASPRGRGHGHLAGARSSSCCAIPACPATTAPSTRASPHTSATSLRRRRRRSTRAAAPT